MTTHPRRPKEFEVHHDRTEKLLAHLLRHGDWHELWVELMSQLDELVETYRLDLPRFRGGVRAWDHAI
jgi:hypothetical protein